MASANRRLARSIQHTLRASYPGHLRGQSYCSNLFEDAIQCLRGSQTHLVLSDDHRGSLECWERRDDARRCSTPSFGFNETCVSLVVVDPSTADLYVEGFSHRRWPRSSRGSDNNDSASCQQYVPIEE